MFAHKLFNADQVNDETLSDMRQQIQEGDIDLAKIRASYKRLRGKDLALSDDEIIFLYAGLEDDVDAGDFADIADSRETGDDEGDEGKTEEEKETEKEQEKIVIDRNTATALKQSAERFGRDYLDAGFVGTMFDIQKADEKTKRGIAIMLFDRLYGPHKWNEDVWGMIPDPRITPKQAKDMQGKSNVPLPRWSFKDGNRARVGDWFETAVKTTKEGAEIAKIIDDVTEAGKDIAGKTPDQQQYVSLGDKGRDRLLRQMEGRLSNIVNRWKRMIRLKLVMDEINQLHPTVRAGLIVEEDSHGNPTRLVDTLDCLVVQKLNAKGEFSGVLDSFMPNTFLRLDPKKVDTKLIETKGNPYDALLSTKDRKTDGPGTSNFKLPTTPNEFIAAMNTLSTYFGDDTAHGSFVKYYSSIKDEKEKREVAQTIEDDHFKLSNFYRVVLPDLEKWEGDQAAAKAKADADKTAKAADKLAKAS